MSPQHWGGGGGGSGGRGRGGKNDRGATDNNIADMATRGSGGQHFMWREEQIKQFVYLIRGGERAVGDEQLRIRGRMQSDDGGGGGGGWQQGRRQT
jgi:hypothetical protein